jgi:hypothetical protein
MDFPSAFYAQRVRQSIQSTLAELGGNASEGLGEAVLIRKGLYCGRRFSYSGGYAIWFIEENQIKYFNANGALCRVSAAPGKSEPTNSGAIVPRRRAA